MKASKTIDRAVTSPSADATSVAAPGPVKVGTVALRGVTVALDTEVGQAFVIDCARNTEGLTPEREIKTKYRLSDRDWDAWLGTSLCSKQSERSVSAASLVATPREKRRSGTMPKHPPSLATF